MVEVILGVYCFGFRSWIGVGMRYIHGLWCHKEKMVHKQNQVMQLKKKKSWRNVAFSS